MMPLPAGSAEPSAAAENPDWSLQPHDAPEENENGENQPFSPEFDSYPTSSGVYLFRDTAGKVVYIGKAKNLRSRLRSYWREGADQRLQIHALRRRIAAVETIVTVTEEEALLLENTLIKDHHPFFNIRLRDDKTYISLRLDLGHRWPRLHRIRKRIPGDREGMYFGPFSSGLAVKETMRFLLSLFPLRSCSDSILANRSRPCILHEIGRCCAPCVKPVDPAEYQGLVEDTIRFLRGRREDVLRLLRRKMEEFSEAMAFEKAAVVRDRLAALEHTTDHTTIVSHRIFDRDVIALARAGGHAVVALMAYRQGKLSESRFFDFRDPDIDDEVVLDQFLSQFYDGTRAVPRDVMLSAAPSNAEMIGPLLASQRGGAVRLHAPQRGFKRLLVETARRNAQAQLERLLAGQRTEEKVLEMVRGKLNLSETPNHIECFDISNIQGSMAVGAMVCFRDGKPEKSAYRHYVIRSVGGADDYAMMKEVLERRYRRAVQENQPLPNLVLLDGGKGQLGVAQTVFEELGLSEKVALSALAKSRLVSKNRRPGAPKVRTEERVFLPGRKNPVPFRAGDPALLLLQQLRDEAHRFGVTFHRQLRKTRSLRSALDALPGIGKTRRNQLLRHFGSVARLREASLQELQAVPRIPDKVAERVYRFLHPDQPDLFPNHPNDPEYPESTDRDEANCRVAEDCGEDGKSNTPIPGEMELPFDFDELSP